MPFASMRSGSACSRIFNTDRVFLSMRRSTRDLLFFSSFSYILFFRTRIFSSLFLKQIFSRPGQLLNLLGSRVTAITCTFDETSVPSELMRPLAFCMRSTFSEIEIPLDVTVWSVQSRGFLILVCMTVPSLLFDYTEHYTPVRRVCIV